MIKALKADSEIKSESSRKYAGVLFYKIDRLFRNSHDFHEVEELMKK
jgi:DNA invertase Pin-like site-specific DNA recombinase